MKSGSGILALTVAFSKVARGGPAIVLAFSMLGGCVVGPDFKTPAPPTSKGYLPDPLTMPMVAPDTHENGAHASSAQEPAQHFEEGAVPYAWWETFQSEALNRLVSRALKNSPDVEAAQASLRAADESVKAQVGAYFPTVSASYTPVRQMVSPQLASPLSDNQYIFNLHTAQLNIGYVPDVFGGNRRQVESLAAQSETLRFQLEATRLTLAANVVVAAINEASVRAQLDATREIEDLQKRQTELSRVAIELGELSQADAAALDSQRAQTELARIQLEKQLALGRDQLAALEGNLPSDTVDETFTLNSITLPPVLPVTLPAKLVEQRPDIRAAEAQLHAASAEIGVAVANRLPNISIDASYGSTGATFASMFSPGMKYWSIGAGLTQPLFEGGTLLHRERAARENYLASLGQYRSVVITAFQGVADALQSIQYDTKALAAAVKFEQAAAHALALMDQRLSAGDAGAIDWIVVAQGYQQARIGLVQARANRFTDTAALYQALGGGWASATSEGSPGAPPVAASNVSR